MRFIACGMFVRPPPVLFIHIVVAFDKQIKVNKNNSTQYTSESGDSIVSCETVDIGLHVGLHVPHDILLRCPSVN